MLLDTILYNLKSNPNKICCKHDKEYTNKEFYEIVCKVYELIKDAPKDKPIVVYGHKEVYMIASFLACSFLGIAYVPVDIAVGKERIDRIIEITKPSYIIGNYIKEGIKSIQFEDIDLVTKYENINKVEMNKNDTYYIIFTSGSTGTPKGVIISYENLDSCLNWLIDVTKINDDSYIIYNQAIFSFDLSVADIYLSLATNSIHYIGNDISMTNLKEKMIDLEESNANMLVITPSSAELFCLSEKFCKDLLPNLDQIIFCGEKLSRKLVDKLRARFPNTKIINMYGPTECTYAVTSVDITNLSDEIIPIGYAKGDVEISIVDSDNNILPDEQIGEIVISGASVGKGYLNYSNDRFISFNGLNSFFTGDMGYKKDGLLYFTSRKDDQIKLRGYRIELSDIERTIEKVQGVKQVKVIAIKNSNNDVQRIEAKVVAEDDKRNAITSQVKRLLPEYMMPKLVFVDKLDLNINGKR